MHKELIFSIILFIFLINLTYAGVPFSEGFYGTVKDTNGNNINGKITTQINNIDSGEANIINGNYNLVVQSSTNFGTIYFYLNNNLIKTSTFNPFEATKLNFLLNTSTPITPPTNNTNTNNTIPQTNQTTTTNQSLITLSQTGAIHTSDIDWGEFCESNWQCFGWSSFNDGIMTRQCTDTNNCPFSYNKPSGITSCEQENSATAIINNNNVNYNPLFIGLGITGFLLIVLLIVVLK
jgi:hypothetical protein